MKKFFFFGSSALVGIPNLSDENTIPSQVENKLNKKYECFNFGLIASKINSEFSLFHQIITEHTPRLIVLYSGYNDLNAAYHGHRFEYYDDVNSLLKMGFDQERKKSSLINVLDITCDTIMNKLSFISKKIFKQSYFLRMEEAQKKRRKILKKKNIIPTYSLSKKNYINYLEIFFYLCNKKKIKTIYIHQPSLLTTNKQLSIYEEEYYKSHKELGLYKNSNLGEDEIEFKKNYQLFKSDAHKTCSEFNIDYIDFEKILIENYQKKNIFFDNVHLTDEGSNILSNIIISKLKIILSEN